MSKWFSNDTNPGLAHQISIHSGDLDINLRKEFESLVLGNAPYKGIGTYLVHREMTGVHCACWDNTRGSSSNCKYCKGESFTWTEKWVRAWFTQTYGRSLTGGTQLHELRPEGIFDKDKAIAYVPAEYKPATGDALFRIRLNAEGKPYYPIERVEKWRCVNVEDRRQENGELAFWLVLCERAEF